MQRHPEGARFHQRAKGSPAPQKRIPELSLTGILHVTFESLPSSRNSSSIMSTGRLKLNGKIDLESMEEMLLENSCTLDRVCAELARAFNVRSTEVGVLRIEGDFLRFLYPVELQEAGRIPISGSGVAAKTAREQKAELYNNFAHVPHRTVFELIKLKDTEAKSEPEPADDAPPKIQKLMSAPIKGEEKGLLGVVQISRKGHHPAAAGPDFTDEELEALERTARRVAILKPEILLGAPKKPRGRLELQNEQKKPKTPARSKKQQHHN
jgi:hypothetical protein